MSPKYTIAIKKNWEMIQISQEIIVVLPHWRKLHVILFSKIIRHKGKPWKMPPKVISRTI